MKISLIYPPLRKMSQHDSIPHALLAIGTQLEKYNYQVEIIDAARYKYSINDVIKRIKNNVPDIIGITGIANSYIFMRDVTLRLKEILPGTTIVGGGHLVSSLPEFILNNTGIDIAVIREGDITITELVEALEKNKDLSNIDGIAFKKNGEYVETKKRRILPDLNILPDSNYKLIDIDYYLNAINESNYDSFIRYFKSRGWKKEDIKAFAVQTGRGCIGTCTFCYRLIPGMRKYSVERVIEKIKYLKKYYNVRIFLFQDELFLSDKEWFKEFAKSIIENNIDIAYRGTVRGDFLDDEICKLLVDSGCFCLNVGFESGSQKMLDRMKKRVTVTDYYNTVRLAKKYNLIIQGNILLGNPEETFYDVYATGKFLLNTKLHRIGPLFVQAYPGTLLYKYAVNNNYITDVEDYLITINDKEATELIYNYSDMPDFMLPYIICFYRQIIIYNRERSEGKFNFIKYIKIYMELFKYKIFGSVPFSFRIYKYLKIIKDKF